MYHGISSNTCPSPNGRESGAELYDVSVANFRAQMNWLKERGLKIVITFDDGEMNNFQEALPILKELGYTAYFFIIVKRVGKNGYMGWKEIKELIDSGMRVGSHGLSHEILTNLMDTQIEEELKTSKRTLEINLNTKIDDLSIPRGFCNDKIIQMAYGLGYKNIFISDRAYHIKSNCFPRIAVRGNWSLKRFEQAMAGQIPLHESLGEVLKKSAKTLLREPVYNWVRSAMLSRPVK